MVKAFYFKLALSNDNAYFDFEHPSVQLVLGTTVSQPEFDRSPTCVWVYRTAEAALSASL